MAFDKLDAHLIGQKAMLEIGTVVDARRQYGNAWLALAARRGAGSKRPAQRLRIVRYPLNLHLRKQLRKNLQHRFAIFQHVAEARRCAGIVIQHEELIITGPHDIGADNVGIDIAGRGHADHIGQIGLIIGDQLPRHLAGPQDFLPMVNVMKERVQRTHPLLDTARKLAPFAGRQNARDNIERNEALFGLFASVHVERDAGAAKKPFRLFRLSIEPAGVFGIEPLPIFLIWLACRVAAP